MKRSITYREITVAIGILVAMLVALTLWIGLPDHEIASVQMESIMPLATLKQLFHNPQLLLSR